MTTSPSTPDLDRLSADDLRRMVIVLLGAVVKLETKVAAQAEEIARLKDLKGRPKLKPSGLEKGTDPGTPGTPGARPPRRKRRGRNKTPPKIARLPTSTRPSPG